MLMVLFDSGLMLTGNAVYAKYFQAKVVHDGPKETRYLQFLYYI